MRNGKQGPGDHQKYGWNSQNALAIEENPTIEIHLCDLPVAFPQIFKGAAGEVTSSLHHVNQPAHECAKIVQSKVSIKFRESRKILPTRALR